MAPAGCILLNGTVGAGKTTTASALGALLEELGVPHAVIDLDELRRAWPAPPLDPFHHELELANLGALARNYRSAGAERIVLAGVVERRSEIMRYEAAAGVGPLFVCRLRVDVAVLDQRLRARHPDPEELTWYLERVGELSGILEAEGLDDLVLDVEGRSPRQLATRIAEAAGWDAPRPSADGPR